MSRPEFLNCIMPVEVIRRIRSEQEFYDKDPEGYERRERESEEARRLEEYQLQQQQEADGNDCGWEDQH